MEIVTMAHQYSYASALAASERIAWRVEDLIGGGKALDFARPFLPESLAQAEPLDFLAPSEKRTLNHIRGHEYLCIFGLVEEFILPFVLDHARERLNEDDVRVRAFLEFAGEEAKHIHLFKRFRAAFEEGFGVRCAVIGPGEAVTAEVLKHHPLAVALAILHIEWMTQAHYLDSVRDDRGLCPQFASLLKHHWMEEAQHAKLDTLMIEAIADNCTAEEIERAVDGYLEIGGFLDAGLMQQVEMNFEALQRAVGRAFSGDQRATYLGVQQRAVRRTYLGCGMTHPNFRETLGRLTPSGLAKVDRVAPAFC